MPWKECKPIEFPILRCADCRTLESFAADSTRQSHRFSVRKDRRRHLHRQIQKYRLDMTHVTERKDRQPRGAMRGCQIRDTPVRVDQNR